MEDEERKGLVDCAESTDECECDDEHIEDEHHHHHHYDEDEHHHHHHEDEDEHHHHHHHDEDEGEHHHHHHHDGDDCDCDDCVSGVSIVFHEDALAGSFSIETTQSKEIVDQLIKESMMLIYNIVEKHEGVVGHIKAAISEGEVSAMYSLTSDDVFRVGDYDKLNNVENISFAAIVYGLDEIVLRSLLVVAKERLL